MDSSRILDISDVTLRFGGVTALEEVSFSVKSKELFAIIGPNGAGKTTLAKLILGHLPYCGVIQRNENFFTFSQNESKIPLLSLII